MCSKQMLEECEACENVVNTSLCCFFKDTVVILRHLCYCIRNFFSMMTYQIWQQLLGHSFTFVYSWQLCFFRLRVTRHLAYALALNLDLFQMSLPYLLFLKCLVARRCISCDLLQPYFHCFSYSLVPSFALKQLSRLAFKNCRREAAAELSKPFFLG